MIMKQLFRHTTSLLRTALLLGAAALFNVLPTQAQSIVEGMPDAFETRDPVDRLSDMLNNGQYYYIQFFDGDESSMNRSYLSDQGAGNVLRSKDYLPFAKNIQWTFISTGVSGQFYLQSLLGNYVRMENGRYISTNNQGDATALTAYKTDDGSHYEISTVANPDNAMYRESGRVWTNIIDDTHSYAHKAHNMSRCFLRIAKLKDNIAHVIYYQDPIYNNQGNVADANGEYRGGREGFGKRHYLTYSGTGAQGQTNGWTSVITNGDLSGTDVSSFYIGENQPATIQDGAGRMDGHGIVVNSAAGQAETWSTQFFVRASDVIGQKTVHLEFDYKANRNIDNIGVQAKTSVFSSYITHIGAIGNLGFTTSWKHYSGDFSIGNDDFRMIAFDLGMTGEQEAATFYFDNIVFSVQPDDFSSSAVSSRSSVMETYDSWSFTTAAKYHEDGLWELVKGADTGTGAEFYIKKYGESQYLTCEEYGDAHWFRCILGSQESTYGRHVLENDNANRFTRIQNNGGFTYTRFLSHAAGDGWPALEWYGAESAYPDFWYAGFLPVEVPNEDGFYRVLLGVKKEKRTDHRIKLTRESDSQGSVTVAEGSTEYSAKFTPSEAYTNVIQYKNFQTGCYSTIKLEFGTSVSAGWNIHTYGGRFDGIVSLAGKTEYEFDLTGAPITDFTIYNDNADVDPISISACYFTPEGPEPDCDPTEMLNHDGTTTAYTTNPLSRKLWELEQVDDYGHFRLKAPDGRYFQDLGQMTNTADNAAVFTNETLLKTFSVEWLYISPELLKKEISATDRMVTHKMSYLREYADDYPGLDLSKQRLASDIDSDWWNNDRRMQKTNHFEITHYVKQGTTIKVDFPTILDNSNDHINFQRFYNYDETDDNMDLDNLKAHVILDTPENGEGDNGVRYYLYKNGIVTGDNLYWEPTATNWKHHATNNFNFTNSDGSEEFKVAVDVSRYSDMKYGNEEFPLDDDLEEPSLTMRYLYYMRDAKVMARKLSGYGYLGDNDIDKDHWMEYKEFHFPSQQVAYNDNKWEGYRGEFIGLRHVFSDYWVFNGGTGNNNLVSAVNDGNASGKIEVKIYDPNNTGITLGGYNPYIDPRGAGTNGAPQVGDKIRVYYSGRNSNFYPIFKHSYNSGGSPADWTELQQTITHVYDSYFEATIPNQATADELTAQGLRFQGRGFTITSIDIVTTEESGSAFRNTSTIWSGNTVFDNENWNTILSINRNNIRVNISNPVLADNYYQGFYFYDKMNTAWGAAPNGKTQYGDSRFIVFRYPKNSSGNTIEVPVDAIENNGKEPKAYIHVYFNDNGTKYQLAQFTVIFDKNSDTRPWKSVNGSLSVEGTERDPNYLRDVKAGKPIAKITFDYPAGDTYHYPPSGTTLHHNAVQQPNGTIANSSPLPLVFDHTNYSFDGDGCNWAAYAMVSQKDTEWGNQKMLKPADENSDWGYNISADAGMQQGFLYIDASEQPGDICAVDFEGEFCEEDKLMCSGWITGSNRYSDNGAYRCPGGITLTVKGEPLEGGENETIYRFCPGQCYELDNGSGIDGSDGASQVVWQQFYFEFNTDKKYKRYWMEVNNNCVSSNGGDFMLDNIEVYAIVPEVEPDVNTPLCVSVDEEGNTVTEMRLLKIKINYNKLLSSRTLVTADSEHPENIGTAEEGFVFLEKYKFLDIFRTGLATKYSSGYNGLDFNTITLDELALAIEKGELSGVSTAEGSPYKTAFDAAILGERSTWHSDSKTENMKSSIMYFRWNSDYDAMEEFSFARAVNKKNAVFREEIGGEKYVVMNGNYPGLNWKTNTDYYIINTANRYDPGTAENPANPCNAFNLCSPCCKSSTFQIDSPYSILGLEKSEGTEDYVVCEGQIPTVALNLKGFDLSGNEVDMTGLNFDWWLGNNAASTAADKLATLDNYHKQHKVITYEEAGVTKTKDVKLDKALAALRSYYPSITSLDGVIQHLDKTPNLSRPEVLYLQEVVSDGQLVLHQSSISVPAEKNSDEDPYFYLVACPIHDEAFNQALNPQDNEYVAYFCDEPQGLRIKVGQKAPTLMTGFVPGEHGFNTYDYAFPEGTNPVLSIRLAKAAQFETVKNEDAEGTTVSTTVNYLWLPIRNAVTQGAPGVFTKASDDNIYLASSNDPTWDKKISKQMSKTGSLPIVGRIVQLEAINTSGQSEEDLKTSTTLQANNRLSVYFTKGFEVREGYNYTLSLPFQEKPDENGDVNSCDGTILINLKIVPDYEVWTGGAGNTDWNNDENWRRADGNTTISNDYYGDELYIANGAKDDENSPLHDYTTNKDNYYSSSKKATAKPSSDQVLRKGFAPLYCTHVLMKSDEWGNAPVLYDAIDGHDVITQTGSRLINAPFPNLRDTSTPILKFDMQARRWDMWEETYGTAPDRGNSDGSRPNDLIAEMYQINSCDEIAMQPGTELLNAQLLNYNSAWMEFELETKRWYLLGSPLQGTISGEWYAPTATEKMSYVPQQKTTYYDDVKFGAGYDRYNPAIYQRSWDKAKAVLYEVGSTYSTADDVEVAGQTYGDGSQGEWKNNGTADVPNWQWQEPTGGADDYLDRLGYKPMGGKKANVAIQGIWSNTYNDAQVDYATGGFSVMVMNHLKGNAADVKAIVRLPKEDKMYDYYEFSEDGSDDGGTDTNISDVQTKDRADYTKRATNRGRLKTDLLLPTQDGIQKSEKEAATYRYVDRRTITRIPIKEADLTTMNSGTFSFTEKVAAGASNLVYYLVENPFPCGLDMTAFFANENNSNLLEKKYWILTKGDDQNPRQQLVQQADGEWVTSDGTPGKWVTSGEVPIEYPNPEGEGNLTFYPNAVVAPGQGFFVAAKTANAEGITVTFTDEMQTQSRFGVIDGNGRTFKVVVGQAQKMEELTDDHGDAVYIEVDLDGDGIYGEDLDLNGNGTPGETYTKEVEEYGETVTRTVIEKEVEIVMVPVYQKDGDNYVLDEEGNKIPVLNDINEDVVIYKYKQEELTQTAKKEYPLRTRGEGAEAILPGLVITAERDNSQSSALVMQRDGASNDFLPEEDTEVFINSDLVNAPTVYTLCGRLATTINTLRDFRSLPLGVESTSDAPCMLTFRGVEMLGDSISFYDAVEQKLTPLESGMTVTVSGQTQNRYYLVRSLNKKDAAEETHLQIFTEGLKAKVIASTAEPITVVRCFDTGGRLLYTASPQSAEHSFDLPRAGVYIIEAETEHDRKTRKVIVK